MGAIAAKAERSGSSAVAGRASERGPVLVATARNAAVASAANIPDFVVALQSWFLNALLLCGHGINILADSGFGGRAEGDAVCSHLRFFLGFADSGHAHSDKENV
jgi:hypothetical protein